MCLICIDFDRQAMSLGEARRALGEMRVARDAEHVAEVEAKLAESERAASAKPIPTPPDP